MSSEPRHTAKSSNDELSTDTGFVALLDVLGFKDMEPSRQQAVADSLELVVDEVWPKMVGMTHDSYSRWLNKPCVRMFSDTIVIAYPRPPQGPVAQDLFHFVNDTLGLLYCYLFTDGFLLRGSIGYGSIWERRYGVFGSAIIDAKAEYEETSWAGIHYSAEATSVVTRWHVWAKEHGVADDRELMGTEHNLNQTQFYVADVPFKPSCKLPTSIHPHYAGKRFVVPWPKDIRAIYDIANILRNDQKTTYARIHEVLDVELQRCNSDRVREILTNTTNFANTYVARFPDVNRPIEWQGPLPELGSSKP